MDNRKIAPGNMMGGIMDPRLMNSFNDIVGPTPIGMPYGNSPMPNMMNVGTSIKGMNMNGLPMQSDSMSQFRHPDQRFQNDSMSYSESNRAGFSEPQPQAAHTMRKRQIDDYEDEPPSKRTNFDSADGSGDESKPPSASTPTKGSEPLQTIPASKEGIKFYSRNDVLCGRGGGTNVHPGNRRFRDLINANRRAYLKARKNDKPAISRSIVQTIREMNGRFLKKDEKLGMWFEIGDDGAREKTSQALRQRAPEMRKILFEDEQRHHHQQEAMLSNRFMGGQPIQAMSAFSSATAGAPSSQGPPPSSEHQDIESSLLARYNMLHQKNLLAQEKNMILQRLALSGMNSQNVQNSDGDFDSLSMQTMQKSGTEPATPRGV